MHGVINFSDVYKMLLLQIRLFHIILKITAEEVRRSPSVMSCFVSAAHLECHNHKMKCSVKKESVIMKVSTRLIASAVSLVMLTGQLFVPETAEATDLIVPAPESGRTVFYQTDFEDGRTADWTTSEGDPILTEDTHGKAYQVQGYDYLEVPNINKLTELRVEFNMKINTDPRGEAWPGVYLKSMGQPTRYEVFFESAPGKEGVNMKKNLLGIVASAPLSFLEDTGQWVYVKLDITGDQVNIYYNNKETPALSYQDPSPLDSGPLGFFLGGCQYFYIDNLLITTPKPFVEEVIPPHTDNVSGGVYLDCDFESGNASPFTDAEGNAPAVEDFGGSQALRVDTAVRAGSPDWRHCSYQFDLTLLDRTLTSDPFTPVRFNVKDERNYFALQFNNVGSTIEIQQYINGTAKWIAQTGFFLGENQTKHIRIDTMDDKIIVYVGTLSYPLELNWPTAILEAPGASDGGIVFERHETVKKMYVDNVRVSAIEKLGEIGPRPDPVPLLTPAAHPAEAWNDLQGHWSKKEVSCLADTGVAAGYPDASFRPESPVAVNEFIKMAVTAMGLETEPVPDEAQWDLPFIRAAAANGLTSEHDFDQVERPITRYEIARIMANALRISGAAAEEDTVPSEADDPAFRQDVALVRAAGIVTGFEDGLFHGEQNATRAEAAVMINRLLVPGRRCRPGMQIMFPEEYDKAFKNPLKGFAGTPGDKYTTVTVRHFNWDQLEDNASDGVEKFIAASDEAWSDLPAQNAKVIPSVVLEWPGDPHWPSDLTDGDYTSPEFQKRLEGFIKKMGEAWDNDPRVAYIRMAIIGLWGEMQSPYPSFEVQKILGEAFDKYFQNKKVQTNIIIRFGYMTDNKVGVGWDSFGHWGNQHVFDFFAAEENKDLWKSYPVGGETAFDWGEPLGTSPNDAVANNLDRLLEVFRFTHCNYIGWLASYNKTDPVITRNAAEIQKTLGYRFVLDQVSYSKTAEPGGRLAVSFSVKNTGSSPIYYNWPVEVSLLDPDTHQPVWRDTFQNTDITSWLPDSDYSCTPLYSAENTFNLPADLPAGEYILALSILDPDGGMLPAVRFANRNYYSGGRHPIGRIGVGTDNPMPMLDPAGFDDIDSDTSLHYLCSPSSAS